MYRYFYACLYVELILFLRLAISKPTFIILTYRKKSKLYAAKILLSNLSSNLSAYQTLTLRVINYLAATLHLVDIFYHHLSPLPQAKKKMDCAFLPFSEQPVGYNWHSNRHNDYKSIISRFPKQKELCSQCPFSKHIIQQTSILHIPVKWNHRNFLRRT